MVVLPLPEVAPVEFDMSGLPVEPALSGAALEASFAGWFEPPHAKDVSAVKRASVAILRYMMKLLDVRPAKGSPGGA